MSTRFYGIYEGWCIDIDDPENKSRIRLKVPQLYGENEKAETGWARPCLPVTSNADHLDHEPHLASQVASVLANHSATITSGSASAGTAHTHSVTLNLSHTGNSGQLSHPHVASTDNQDPNPDEAEHSPHRLVPRINQRVWVMFIAGDPNFPVWIGVQP
jgi:hypothetical protein